MTQMLTKKAELFILKPEIHCFMEAMRKKSRPWFYWENRDMLHLEGILFYYLLYIYATNRVSRSVFYFIKFSEEDGVWLVIKKEVA